MNELTKIFKSFIVKSSEIGPMNTSFEIYDECNIWFYL